MLVGIMGDVLSTVTDVGSLAVDVEGNLLVDEEGVVLNSTGVGRLLMTAFPCESMSSTCE